MAQLRGCRGCGATLIGDRVTGVRVTPISGFLVGVGRWVGRYTGACWVSSGGGGGGAGGAGGTPTRSDGEGAGLVVDGEGDVVGDGVSLGAESLSSNSTPEITMAAAARPVAISASVARRVRYQGTGAGLNDQS
ncbi:hypothetical protein A5699_10130 [Mycobacterium sp. E802]|nr:hypothetical protein A5699_10130 [Mycobacterium sp. E802]